MSRRKRYPAQDYVDGILASNRVMLSRAITLIESTLPSDQQLAREVVAACMPHTGRSLRLGITGVPGVGKSTFIDAFGSMLAESQKVAVLAVDPSSSLSKGSILGDKTRMNRLSHHPKAYIRPSATAGSLGGVARKTRESLLLCEAAGYEIVIVETVGVGQSEIAVHSMVDFFLLLMLPNAGDELQGIKKGIVEMADAIAVNKADGHFLQKARMAKSVYAQALRLFPASDSGWKPKVMLCSAQEETGLDDIWEMLQAYREGMEGNRFWEQKRSNQALHWMRETVQQQLLERFYADEQVQKELGRLEERVQAHEISPIQAAEELLGLREFD